MGAREPPERARRALVAATIASLRTMMACPPPGELVCDEEALPPGLCRLLVDDRITQIMGEGNGCFCF